MGTRGVAGSINCLHRLCGEASLRPHFFAVRDAARGVNAQTGPRKECLLSFSTMPLAPETRAVLQTMGITDPTPIQTQSLPYLLAGRDLVGQARTGSGKTLAFAIPMIEKVDAAIRAVQAIVLVPTRELAQQVGEVVETLGRANRVRSVCIFGGRAMGPQISAINAGPQVIIGTPGRVLDLLKQGVLKLDRVNYVVLDEADEMLDRGFAPDVERILSFAPRDRQTALFSATVPEWVQGTAAKYLRDPAMVQIDTRPEDVPKIDHIIYDVPENQKLSVLRVLLDGRGDESVLVFGRTKHGVKKLARQLVALGYPAAALQGNLSQNARDKAMADFRNGSVPILLATNVAARGLDVENIGMVINYELPETTELLTHRVGRTGRMGREGDAVTLLVPSDEPKWRQLSRSLRVRIPRKQWTGDLPAVPASIDAFPLYPKREERRTRVERPAPLATPASRQRAPLPAGVPERRERSERPGRPERPERSDRRDRPAAATMDRPRLQPERITARRDAPISPDRFRFVASDQDERANRPQEREQERPMTHESAMTTEPGLLPPALSTQVEALLSRYQQTGTVATPVDVPLTRRAPQRTRREEHGAAEESTASTRPESRSERARTFGRGAGAPSSDAAGAEDADTGVITKIVKERGFGFLRDGAGIERFFHRNDVSDGSFDALQIAQPVRFTPDPTTSGPRPIARAVEMVTP